MEIDHRLLDPVTLRAVIEEFVTRDGTDYGARETSFEAKVEQVRRLLEEKRIRLVFDAETESCDLREAVNGGRTRPKPD